MDRGGFGSPVPQPTVAASGGLQEQSVGQRLIRASRIRLFEYCEILQYNMQNHVCCSEVREDFEVLIVWKVLVEIVIYVIQFKLIREMEDDNICNSY